MQVIPAIRADIAATRPKTKLKADAINVTMNCAARIRKIGDLVQLPNRLAAFSFI
jgi:hypothetical protein